MKKFTLNDVPIYSWCDEIEDGAMKQIENLTRLPFVHHHVAIMADCHQGFGMPIGGVLATNEVIIPNAVGVDIGCGMRAVQTSVYVEELPKKQLETLLWGIRGLIPTGFKKHDQPMKKLDLPAMEDFGFRDKAQTFVVEQHFQAARKQVGTLGGGNHFIEIQADEDGLIWLMIHSGSRNVGLQVAKFYHKRAVEERMRTQTMRVKDLAHLEIGSDLADDYVAEMGWCVAFAKRNRAMMMGRVMGLFDKMMHCDFSEAIDVAHNFAALERHFEADVWVHRKGATRAKAGEFGIIPGSQGTMSYVVRGKGSVNSFESCSHGAGRLMSRKKAVKTLDLRTEQHRLNSQGILHSLHSQRDLDEASSAYKDIDVVMAAQTDLVDVVVGLRPLAVVKG